MEKLIKLHRENTYFRLYRELKSYIYRLKTGTNPVQLQTPLSPNLNLTKNTPKSKLK